MSQRVSGYARKERDLYETPAWVTEVLLDNAFCADAKPVMWEPAAGNGAIARVLRQRGFTVSATDLVSPGSSLTGNFLLASEPPLDDVEAIVTNPPYTLAQEFIEHALKLMRPVNGMVAMLLRVDFDSAFTRRHLFGRCPDFWMKIVLTKRIRWIADSTGSPSFNHAWYVWICGARESPTLVYAP